VKRFSWGPCEAHSTQDSFRRGASFQPEDNQGEVISEGLRRWRWQSQATEYKQLPEVAKPRKQLPPESVRGM
jgi:hypothetical protein